MKRRLRKRKLDRYTILYTAFWLILMAWGIYRILTSTLFPSLLLIAITVVGIALSWSSYYKEEIEEDEV